jgi:hypothetical protein
MENRWIIAGNTRTHSDTMRTKGETGQETRGKSGTRFSALRSPSSAREPNQSADAILDLTLSIRLPGLLGSEVGSFSSWIGVIPTLFSLGS